MVIILKVITKRDIGKLIKDNDMVAISGSGGSGSCEDILMGIRESFLLNGHPRNIGVTCGISPGNLTRDLVGMNILAEPGLVGKAICAHLGMGKVFGEAVGNNQFPAFAVPLGVINHLYRAIGGQEIGVFTHIGLNTFADPRYNGCRANDLASSLDDIVKLVHIDNKEILFYKSFPINVAVIKGTYADQDGNISLEEEAVIGEQYNMAIAAHNSGGIVIAQVKEIKPKGSLKARNVLVHSSLVDYVLVAQPDKSLKEYNMPEYRPEVTGDKKIKIEIPSRGLDARKVCARRAFLEIKKGDVINLGVGMPDGVANVAYEENCLDDIYLSVEVGPTGGMPIGGIAFGGAINPDSVISTASQFDAYNGGSLDMAILGIAQVDKKGNVNVSKFGSRVTGPGGFINITQPTKKIIFMGTFMADGLEEEIKNGNLHIVKEGTTSKFVEKVEQVTFSTKEARKHNQDIWYVTERAVFKLVDEGIMLVEIAEGIDLENDVLAKMSFKPLISKDLKIMDPRIFKEEKMATNRH